MKRLLFTLMLCAAALGTAAQSGYQMHYWFDHDFASRQTTGIQSTHLIDVAQLRDGFHTLSLMIDSDGRVQQQAFLFYKQPPADVPQTCSYWFDNDYTTNQSSAIQSAQLIEVSQLRNGFHTLHLRIGDNLNAQLHSFLFYKPALSDGGQSFEYWFDHDQANAISGPLSLGGVTVDVAQLRDGFHTLFIRINSGLTTELRSSLFFKAPLEDSAATVAYWFDSLDSAMTVKPIGNGLVMLDVTELSDTNHTVFLMVGSGSQAQLHSCEFQKVPVVYTVALDAADSTMGSVSGEGDYPRGSTVSIAATTEYGYHFARWSDGDTNALRSIVLTQDTTLTAFFARDTFQFDITVGDTATGSVILAGSGAYLTNDTATAVPAYGYHFAGWSDGDTANPRVVTLTQDTALSALFEPNIYSVVLASDDEAMGGVSGSGDYPYLSVVPVEATAVTGYQFSRWSDGNDEPMRQLVVRGDTALTAFFELQRFTLTVNSNDLSRGFTRGGGTFTVFDTTTALAVTLAGNSFLGWSDGSTDNPRQLQLWCDTTVTALFEPLDSIPETIVVHDTTTLTVHDTVVLTLTDTLTVAVHDTAYVEVPFEVHDTTYVEVPYAVHDTTYVVQTDTGYINVTVHDTVYVDVEVPYEVHDTTYVVQTDSVSIYVHDTVYLLTITVHDTTYVVDTLTLTEYIDVPVHDTTYVDVPFEVHDTTYIDVPFDVHDTTFVDVHDTTYITLTDTVTNTLYDTVTNTIYDTVTNTVYDTVDNYIIDTTTVFLTDTLWLTDTLYVYDTVYIHDTIYVDNDGIDDVESANAKIYQRDGRIVVESGNGVPLGEVAVYDAVGRMVSHPALQAPFSSGGDGNAVAIEVPASGVYLVKIGNLPARRVVVIR